MTKDVLAQKLKDRLKEIRREINDMPVISKCNDFDKWLEVRDKRIELQGQKQAIRLVINLVNEI